MANHWRFGIAALCLSLGAVSTAAASTILSFTGSIYDGKNAGTTVSGYVTYDLEGIQYWRPNATTNVGYQSYHPPYSSPLRTSGYATYGAQTVSFGGTGQFDQMGVYVFKNNGADHGDEFMVNIGTYDGGEWTQILLRVGAFTDGIHASGIFNNTDYNNVDWRLDQQVNWFAPGSTTFGMINSRAGYEFFRLDSVTITDTDVPEPAGYALCGVALLGLLAARRRRTAVRT